MDYRCRHQNSQQRRPPSFGGVHTVGFSRDVPPIMKTVTHRIKTECGYFVKKKTRIKEQKMGKSENIASRYSGHWGLMGYIFLYTQTRQHYAPRQIALGVFSSHE